MPRENDDLTLREIKVWEALQAGPQTIGDMARELFARERPFAKAQSRVRNALRRLVKCRLVRQIDRGTYVALQVNDSKALAPLPMPSETSSARDEEPAAA